MKFLSGLREKAAGWRLPVRIPVPNRDNLIAMGLMALAFGLMVGVAIGPALGAASNAVAGMVAPLTSAPPPATEETLADSADSELELDSPAGSESGGSETVADVSESSTDSGDSTGSTGGSTDYSGSEYPESDPPVDENPAKVETDPDPVVPDEEESGGTELKGAVVAVDPDGTGYDVADASGNVLALHATAPPVVGEGVVTRIDPLANGTFAEVGERKVAGLKTKSKLRGTVSWIDPAAKLAVVSSRGSSIAVDLNTVPEDPAAPILVGSPVEAVVTLGEPVLSPDGLQTRPGLIAQTFAPTGEPVGSFDLNGPVSATGLGARGRELSVAADSGRLIPAEIPVETPAAFDPALVKPGKVYNLSVELTPAGGLKLIGLSADYSVKAAGDPAAAFGTHS